MKKKWIINLILLLVFLLTIYFAYLRPLQKKNEIPAGPSEEDLLWMDDVTTKQGAADFIKTIRLEVPLYDQFAEPALENGSSVTSLSMLLAYYGFGVDKNQLADQMPGRELASAPDFTNPNTMVTAELLAKLAKLTVGEEYTVVTGEERSFAALLEVIQKDKPVLLNVTQEIFQLSEDGQKKKPDSIQSYHAIVLTGMDETFVYYNDPFENKEKAIQTEKLHELYDQTNRQYIYLK